MSLDIGKALRDGVGRTTARNGLVLAAVFVAFRLVNAVVNQSLGRVWAGEVLDDLAANPPSLEGTELTRAEFQQALADIREAVRESTQLAYLDSLSVAELIGIAVVLAVVAEAIRIVAVRVFVSPETESLPAALMTRNLLPAVVNGIVGRIVAAILIGVGLVFLVVPGVFLFIAFLFLRQEIAVEDENFIRALSESWTLTSGHRLELFALVVALVVISLVASLVAGFLGSSVVATVVNTAVGALVLTYSVAVVSRAYDQLRTVDATPAEEGAGPDDDSEEFADIDDELLP